MLLIGYFIRRTFIHNNRCIISDPVYQKDCARHFIFSFRSVKSIFSVVLFPDTATKCVACETRQDFSVESTASAIMSEMFIALKVNIWCTILHRCFTYNFFYFLACSYSKYFVNCLWTFVFVPTRKSNAAKFIARKELE